MSDFVCQRKEVWGNNRSVMSLDVLGWTRATVMRSTILRPCLERLGKLLKTHCDGKIIAIINLQRGIPSNRESLVRADYVPAFYFW